MSENDLTFLSPGSRVTLPWSAFSECRESSELFVLLDRPKKVLYVIPKRAFPSESWQSWFRELAANAPGEIPPPVSVPAQAASADRIALTLRPGFRDHAAVAVASWRTWGFCLFVASMLVGVFVLSAINPPPNAVNSAAEVFFLFLIPAYLGRGGSFCR